VLIPGDGSRPMQWVDAADVARAGILAADSDAAAGHAYNLGNWPPVTQVEFVQALARAAGREVRLVPVERERIEAAGGGLISPPLYFGAFLDLPSLTVQVRRVQSELGLELKPLEDGLREAFLWYREQQRPEPDFSWEEKLVGSGR